MQKISGDFQKNNVNTDPIIMRQINEESIHCRSTTTIKYKIQNNIEWYK